MRNYGRRIPVPLSIKMIIDKRPGVLSRVIRALKDLDHTLVSNTLSSHSESNKMILNIASNGPEQSMDDVLQCITLVSGVNQVVTIQGRAIPQTKSMSSA